MTRFFRYFIVFLGLCAAAWTLGLVLFVTAIEMQSEPVISDTLQPTDAIVVLTGGSERLMTGLQLLNSHKAKKLFVSGVHQGLNLDHVLGTQPVDKELRTCCIVLGHAAESTMGNGDETLTWLAIEKFRSMRLVTSNYHMPRSLMIFRATMPDIQIIPHPISPESVKLEGWWMRPGTARLLVTEYNKYLVAFIRLRLGLK